MLKQVLAQDYELLCDSRIFPDNGIQTLQQCPFKLQLCFILLKKEELGGGLNVNSYTMLPHVFLKDSLKF